MHPFSVVSWTDGAQDTLELIIRPQGGLSVDIFKHCRNNSMKETRKRAFISGPYGHSVSVWYYKVVVLVANDLGVVALLPYLEKLIHGYLLGMGCRCKVYLIWHAQELDLLNAISPSLDQGLRDDPERLFDISIYHEHKLKNIPNGERLNIIEAVPDFEKIITQVVQDSLEGSTTLLEDRASVLILVSGTGALRDIARDSVKKYSECTAQLGEINGKVKIPNAIKI
ncbi:hypothetical protein TruAng_011727 [Truncatella angustata]|nr:hypothetical protein TruAng_011727 [Truncatella angustata]